jgi:hypothetical protein
MFFAVVGTGFTLSPELLTSPNAITCHIEKRKTKREGGKKSRYCGCAS